MGDCKENRKFYEEKVPVCQLGQRPEDMWRIHELETEISKLRERNNDESESEQQNYRDSNNVPTEMAVLRREYIDLRAKNALLVNALESIIYFDGHEAVIRAKDALYRARKLEGCE